ncbi:Myoneurin [Porphyridium purpureum]|uniref:Myoneurin n=1 Tax=Porphyridium purpureum TaxID=35688 RepID=A0A5J4YHQ0_PORPP|nr:Myoneurin [Porphyridium purpureum]|eukprot:POR7327..scf289_17
MSANSIMRVLLEEDDVHEWCVKWTQQKDTRAQTGGAAAVLVESALSSSGNDETSGDIRVDVKASYNEVLPEDLRCLPFLPTTRDLDSAVVVDNDISHMSDGKTLILYLPMYEKSRFCFGVLMQNTTLLPLPPGVYKLPGHRFVGFRTRYGHATINVAMCSDGSVIVNMLRLWDNRKARFDTFRTWRIEDNAGVLSHATMGSSGSCQPDCTDKSTCVCWRQLWHRRTDNELAAPLSWSQLGTALRQGLVTPSVDGLGVPMEIHVSAGNGAVKRRMQIPVNLQNVFGRDYSDMNKLRFVFFDRLTTASSVRHSPLLTDVSDANDGATSDRLRRDGQMRTRETEYGAAPTMTRAQLANPSIGECFSADDSGEGATRESAPQRSCDKCGKAFRRVSELRRHIRHVHDKIRPYICDACGFTFSQRSHLKTHARVVHDGRYDYTCTVCGAVFGALGNFRRHMESRHRERSPS